jgi:hypothetical protein
MMMREGIEGGMKETQRTKTSKKTKHSQITSSSFPGSSFH